MISLWNLLFCTSLMLLQFSLLGAENKPVLFTENKGQVSDQNNKPRTDVLFYGASSGMSFYLKNNGLSYQLYKVSSWKEKREELPGKTSVSKVPDNTTIYRLDINWPGANLNASVEKEEAVAGYENYYLSVCPGGIRNVKKYEGVKYINLYNNIDLHYYSKEDNLKYDYIIKPGGDYKQIQFQINGAEKIGVGKDGKLIIETPLGKISEQAPLVNQNGKKLQAKWVVNKNIVSFEIKGIDSNVTFTIDPLVRHWGTYFGGSNTDKIYGTDLDLNGDLIVCGYTGSGNNIATSGSFQNTLTSSWDGFVSKFSPSGNLLWSTYYGGLGISEGLRNCVADNKGNIYCAGYSNDTTNVIATIGSHQFSNGGGTDAFLVKFNSAGTRIWSTYYGGSGAEVGYSCSVDSFSNVFLCGSSTSILSNIISTSGAHQLNYGGGSNDAFLVKFDSNGVRQWGTYYGGTAYDIAYGCNTDKFGNVYIVGGTASSGVGDIASTNGQQNFYGGGSSDGFIAKFDLNGIRQWGSYYGSIGFDLGWSTVTDSQGNVYITGQTNSMSSWIMTTPNGFQPTYTGNSSTSEAYLAKFDSAGVRIWGTYYGDDKNEVGYDCDVDSLDNIYLFGESYAAPTGSNVVTANAHQPTFGGGPGYGDGFMAMFDSAGVRQYGTYYGGSNIDRIYSGCVSPGGEVYLAGETNTPSSLAEFGIKSFGSYQPTFGGVEDAFIAKLGQCPMPLTIGVNTQTNVSCSTFNDGKATILATGGSSIKYVWTPTVNITSSGNTAILLTPGSYSCSITNSCGSNTVATINITAPPTPTMTVGSSKSSVCVGDTITFSATGAPTYSWSNSGGFYGYGQNIVFSPTSNTSPVTFTVYGTPNFTCNSNTNLTISVSVNPSPTLALWYSNILACSGTPVSYTLAGANTYTWHTGSTSNPYTVTATTTTNYSVTGTDSLGCKSSTISVPLTVIPSPSVYIIPSKVNYCVGDTVMLKSISLWGSSPYNYNWLYTSNNTNTNIVQILKDTFFIVNVVDGNGCSDIDSLIVLTSSCVGVNELDSSSNNFRIYPNPNAGIFFIETTFKEAILVEIMDAIGKCLKKFIIHPGESLININELSQGIYFIKINDFRPIKINKQ